MTTTSTALYGSIAGPKSISATVALSPDFMSTTDFEAVEETSTGVVTVLTAGVHYSLALDSTPPSSATLTFLYNLSSGNSVHWRRKTVLDQQTALTALGTFPTASVERAFDKAILALQEPDAVAPAVLRSFSFGANWSAVSTTPKYYKHQGRVYMEGAVASTAAPTLLQTIATLPVGYRPVGSRIFSIPGTESGSSALMRYEVIVTSTGLVQWGNSGTANELTSLYLDGVHFRLV